MPFLTRIGFLETPEQERERLAQAPEGSLNHQLSQLPVTVDEWPEDLVIELPSTVTSGHRLVVVPIEYRGDGRPEGEAEPLPRKRHSGWWACAVVATEHPDYRVGGHRLSIPAAELARGRKIDILAQENQR